MQDEFINSFFNKITEKQNNLILNEVKKLLGRDIEITDYKYLSVIQYNRKDYILYKNKTFCYTEVIFGDINGSFSDNKVTYCASVKCVSGNFSQIDKLKV